MYLSKPSDAFPQFCIAVVWSVASKPTSVDKDQTAPVGAVWSGSTMFAYMLMLNKHFQMQLFCCRFKD